MQFRPIRKQKNKIDQAAAEQLLLHKAAEVFWR